MKKGLVTFSLSVFFLIYPVLLAFPVNKGISTLATGYNKNMPVHPVSSSEPFSGQSSVFQLPLHIFPASNEPGLPLVFMISGDGGWGWFDQQLALHLAKKNIPCIGLDAFHYFWNKKTPEMVAYDIEPVINYYLKYWNREKIILIGYSFGAEIVPFVARKFNPSLRNKTALVVMLSPTPRTGFEIHFIDMLSIDSRKDTYDVVNEIRNLQNTKVLCIFGQDENTKIPSLIHDKRVHFYYTKGGHHFDRSYDEIIQAILKDLN